MAEAAGLALAGVQVGESLGSLLDLRKRLSMAEQFYAAYSLLSLGLNEVDACENMENSTRRRLTSTYDDLGNHLRLRSHYTRFPRNINPVYLWTIRSYAQQCHAFYWDAKLSSDQVKRLRQIERLNPPVRQTATAQIAAMAALANSMERLRKAIPPQNPFQDSIARIDPIEEEDEGGIADSPEDSQNCPEDGSSNHGSISSNSREGAIPLRRIVSAPPR